MKFVKRITAFVCSLSMLSAFGADVLAQTDTSYRQLQDYEVFNGNGNINWCGGPNLEVLLWIKTAVLPTIPPVLWEFFQKPV